MTGSWFFQVEAWLISGLLAVLMVYAAFIGARWGLARKARGAAGGSLTSVETGLFGLLGLLLAFTFSGAASRFEARGALMVDSAVALHSAILRADAFAPAERDGLRRELAAWLATQVRLYHAEQDEAALKAAVEAGRVAQQALWTHAQALARDPAQSAAATPLLNALDRVFALSLSRQVAARQHMPDAIVGVLFVLAIATAYATGYGSGLSGGFSWAGYIGFSLLTAVVVYVTLDLDRPGRGIIRRDMQEQVIEGMGALLRS